MEFYMQILTAFFFSFLLWLFITASLEGILGDSSSYFALFVTVSIVVIYAVKAYEESDKNIKQNYSTLEKKREKLRSEFGMKTSLSSLNMDQNALICLDRNLGKLYIDNAHTGKDKKFYSGSLIDIKNIREIELKENNVGIFNIKTTTAASIASAAVGGILLGGTGAVVGAIAGQNQNRVQALSLVVHVNDPVTPIITFDFVGNETIKKGTPEYQRLARRAETWVSRILAVLTEIRENQLDEDIKPAEETPKFLDYKSYLIWCAENDADPMPRSKFEQKFL